MFLEVGKGNKTTCKGEMGHQTIKLRLKYERKYIECCANFTYLKRDFLAITPSMV